MVLNQWVWKIFAVASPIRVFQNSPTFWGICSLALIYQGYSSHTCFFSHGDDSKKPEFTQIPFKNPYQAKHLNILHCTAKFPTQPRRVWFRQVPPNNDGFYVHHKGGQLYRPYRLRCRMSNRGNGFRQAACVVFCVATYWISCGGCFCWKIFSWWYLLPWYPWGRWSKFNFTTGAYVWYCSIRFLKLSKSFNHRI